jgi:hypothetical protein
MIAVAALATIDSLLAIAKMKKRPSGELIKKSADCAAGRAHYLKRVHNSVM